MTTRWTLRAEHADQGSGGGGAILKIGAAHDTDIQRTMRRCRFKHAVAVEGNGQRVVRAEPDIPYGCGREIARDDGPAGGLCSGVVQRQTAGEQTAVCGDVNHSGGAIGCDAVNLAGGQGAGHFIPKQSTVHGPVEVCAGCRQRRVRAIGIDPDARDAARGGLGSFDPGGAAVMRGQQFSVGGSGIGGRSGETGRAQIGMDGRAEARAQGQFGSVVFDWSPTGGLGFRQSSVGEHRGPAVDQSAHHQVRQILVEAAPRQAAVERPPHSKAVRRHNVLRIRGCYYKSGEAIADDRPVVVSGQIQPSTAVIVGGVDIRRLRPIQPRPGGLHFRSGVPGGSGGVGIQAPMREVGRLEHARGLGLDKKSAGPGGIPCRFGWARSGPSQSGINGGSSDSIPRHVCGRNDQLRLAIKDRACRQEATACEAANSTAETVCVSFSRTHIRIAKTHQRVSILPQRQPDSHRKPLIRRKLAH